MGGGRFRFNRPRSRRRSNDGRRVRVAVFCRRTFPALCRTTSCSQASRSNTSALCIPIYRRPSARLLPYRIQGLLPLGFHLLSTEEYGVHQHAQDRQQYEQDTLPDRVAHHHCCAVHHSHRPGSAPGENKGEEKEKKIDPKIPDTDKEKCTAVNCSLPPT